MQKQISAQLLFDTIIFTWPNRCYYFGCSFRLSCSSWWWRYMLLLFAVVMAGIKTPAVIRKRNQRPLEVLIIASNFACRQ
jgi:branched-subunit amino acid transport protein